MDMSTLFEKLEKIADQDYEGRIFLKREGGGWDIWLGHEGSRVYKDLGKGLADTLTREFDRMKKVCAVTKQLLQEMREVE